MLHRPRALQLTSTVKRRLRLCVLVATCFVAALVGAVWTAAGVAREMGGSQAVGFGPPLREVDAAKAANAANAAHHPEPHAMPPEPPHDSPPALLKGTGVRR